MEKNTYYFNVQETFQSTLQGEGYFSGRVADFIRLYGCPVGCFFCDTGYSLPDGDYYKKKLPKILDQLKIYWQKLNLNL